MSYQNISVVVSQANIDAVKAAIATIYTNQVGDNTDLRQKQNRWS
jgi:hypothetical protein